MDSKRVLCWASLAALTAGQHEGTLAHAVVVVHVLGTEVGAVDDQAALSARRPTVAFQEQSETHHRGRKEGRRRVEEAGVSVISVISSKDSKET